MKVAIWGAGGIGCYYGARLLKAGHEVTFIARGEHLHALQTVGLKVTHESLSFQQADIQAYSQEQWLEEDRCQSYDLIILAIKANATTEVLEAAKDWLLAGDCPILSLQNGVDNEAIIASVIGRERTIGGLAVKIGGHILEPGVIEARGIAQIVCGMWPMQVNSARAIALQKLVDAFNDADILTTLTPNIQRELWRKLLINNGVNPLSALTGLDTKALTSDPVHKHVVYKMMEEAAHAAQHDGVEITEDDVNEMFTLISEFDAIKTSMLVDREKGRPLELDGITGAVLRRSQSDEKTLMTAFISTLLQAQYECR